MTQTLLHAMARAAEAITPDADLLTRYTRERDHRAFEELVRRHGPLVWAVCRNLLPHHADAEDAFQAVFLALVRSASSIRDGRSVPAWLHGVAVRIATRAKREFARRRERERTVAIPEADRSMPDAAWESLVALVHEEVQRLPEAERTAFVLCDLQGVSQSDAAARLGWPLGSVSGRLCKARQRLLDRLSARGVAPAAVVGIGLTAGAASALPAKLFDAVKLFPSSPGAASGVATALARGLTEGVAMRVKLTAAAAVMVAALGVTGGALVLSKADAQPPGGTGSSGGKFVPPGGTAGSGFAPPMGGVPGAPPGGFGFSGPPRVPALGGPPMGAASGPGTPGAGFSGGWAASSATVDYKFVDVKNDRKAFESTIIQQGKEGWEFCGSERFNQGDLTLVFKKSRGGVHGMLGGMMGGMPGMGAPGGLPGGMGMGGQNRFDVLHLKNAVAGDVVAALQKAFPKANLRVVAENASNSVVIISVDPAVMKDILKMIEQLDAKPGSGPKAPPGAGAGPGGPPPGIGSGMPPGPMGAGAEKPAETFLTVFSLKHAKAEEAAAVFKKLFRNADIEAYSVSNSLIVRTDEKTLEEIKALLTRLDMDSDNKRPK